MATESNYEFRDQFAVGGSFSPGRTLSFKSRSRPAGGYSTGLDPYYGPHRFKPMVRAEPLKVRPADRGRARSGRSSRPVLGPIGTQPRQII